MNFWDYAGYENSGIKKSVVANNIFKAYLLYVNAKILTPTGKPILEHIIFSALSNCIRIVFKIG